MSDRDDAPPAEASAALAMAAAMFMTTNMQPADGWRGIRDSLPDAARWRLAAWIAAGLGPTREMVEAGMAAYRANNREPRLEPTLPSIITAALRARAKETENGDALKAAAKAAKIAKDAYSAAEARMDEEEIFDDVLLSELQEDEDRAMEAFYELCTPETILELLK